MSLLEDLLAEVPDEPVHIDFRGLLLEGPELFGTASGALALRADGRLLAVFKRPQVPVLEAALRAARDDAEIVAPAGARRWLGRALEAEGERAFLHRIGKGGLRGAKALPEAVLLDERAELTHLPDLLREEIETARRDRPVAAVLEDGRPVALCHPTLLTERYWDVSIETLPGHRRGGRATAAFLRLEEEMRGSGRQPVWGAVESNVASLRLAETLGFERVGEIALLRP